MEIILITAATPQIIPRAVNADFSLFIEIASMAIQIFIKDFLKT
jgi:hypothetical protein